jgi:hypothetical protein
MPTDPLNLCISGAAWPYGLDDVGRGGFSSNRWRSWRYRPSS